MADRLDHLYRVTGVAKFHLPAKVSDDDVAQAVLDLRRWKREHDNDADLGSAYEVDVDPGEARGESVEFYLHVNDVRAVGQSAAMTWGIFALRDRLAQIGRSLDDAFFVDMDATRQRRRPMAASSSPLSTSQGS